MENAVRSIWVNGTEQERGEISRVRLMISDIQDQPHPNPPADTFYLEESEHTLWFYEEIRQYQGSSALQGANLQRWKLYKISKGKYQLLCKDRWGDILIAKLIKKKLAFNELSIVYIIQ